VRSRPCAGDGAPACATPDDVDMTSSSTTGGAAAATTTRDEYEGCHGGGGP
jgi:hypothetical protein